MDRAVAELVTAAALIVALADKSTWSKALKNGAQAIRSALQKEELAKAKSAYELLAKDLQPLGEVYDKLPQLQRPDEKRKLKTVVSYLRRIKRMTVDGYLDKVAKEVGGEVNSYTISMSLESLEEAVKSVVRYYDRIEGYLDIEEKIKHEKFTLINKHGYRPDEYEEALSILDSAAEKIKNAGFTSLLYGDIYLVSKGDEFAGQYNSRTDVVSLNVTARYRFDAIHTLIHEFGHRHWHQELTDAKREQYEDTYSASTDGALSIEVREKFWDAYRKSGFDAKRAATSLDEELRELFRLYYKDRKSVILVRPDPRLEITEDKIKRSFIMPKLRYYFLKSRPKSVTDYGSSDVGEDYAEIFALYCFGNPLPADAAARFEAATGKS